MHCLDPGPFSSKWNMHVWEEGEGPSLGSVPPDSCFTVSRDSEGVGATGEGQPLYTLYALLQGLATKRVCILHFETIVLLDTPPPLH
jgi:hypothetical protein